MADKYDESIPLLMADKYKDPIPMKAAQKDDGPVIEEVTDDQN